MRLEFGNDKPLTLFAGPCQIESADHAFMMAEKLGEITDTLGIPFVFKASFDKANRTSWSAPRGIGLKDALPVFDKISIFCDVMTDVHEPWQCEELREYVDVLQIPALLSRQTDLIEAVVKTGLSINIKKGQFMAPWDALAAAKKAAEIAISLADKIIPHIMITERGTTFGYGALVNDFKGVEYMKVDSRDDPGWPVVFDATHSVQMPGLLGHSSGGSREYVECLAKAATAVGVAGIFIETHDDPINALSDGPCMVPLDELPDLVKKLMAIDAVVKQ